MGGQQEGQRIKAEVAMQQQNRLPLAIPVPTELAINLAILDWGESTYNDKVHLLKLLFSWTAKVSATVLDNSELTGQALTALRIWGDIQYYMKEYEK